MIDKQLEKFLKEDCGYIELKYLDNNLIGINPYMFTWGLCYGLTLTGLSGRFCYPDLNTCLAAFNEIKILDTQNYPLDEYWIKHKSSAVEYSNPLKNLCIGSQS